MNTCINFRTLLFSAFMLFFSIYSFAQTDVAVTIVSPSEGTFCVPQITPEVVLLNEGETNISVIVYNYQIDGGEPVNAIWAGGAEPLTPGSEITITLDPIALEGGSHSFSFQTQLVNGLPDSNPDNNLDNVQFTINSGLGITLEIALDDFPEETSFTLTDENDEILVIGNQGEFNGMDFEIITYEVCAGEGCFVFTILDSFGDGICCGQGEGYFTIFGLDGTIVASGGEFNNEETVEFCLEPLILEELDAKLGSIVSPEEGEAICSSEIDVAFEIKNDGLTEITSILFEYSIDGEVIGQEEWNGLLFSLETEVITIPAVAVVPGDHIIDINILEVNGIVDDFLENNSLSSSYIGIDGDGFTVTIETTEGGGGGPGGGGYFVQITSSSGEEIFNDFIGDEEMIEFTVCQAIDCYDVFTDTFGGVEGTLTVTNSDGNVIALIGDTEGGANFCSDFVPLENNAALNGFANIEFGDEFCGENISPIINFQNTGIQNMTTAEFQISLDGAIVETISWTGDIEPFGFGMVEFNEIIIGTIGNHDLEVLVISVNGEELVDLQSEEITFVLTEGDPTIVSVNPDGPGFQVSYFIFNDNDELVVSVENDLEGGEDNIETYCLPPGCYTFFISQFQFGGGGGGDFDTPEFSVTWGSGVEVVSFEEFDEDFTASFCTESYELPAIDMAISKITSPFDEEKFCSNTISPKFEILNSGESDLTSAEIEYKIDAEASQTFSWTGNLSSFESTIVNLPDLSNIDAGTHVFTASVVSANGAVDGNEDNNTKSSEFEIIDGDEITLIFDGAAINIDFTIIDENGTIIYADNFFQFEAFETNYCLGLGCYSIVISRGGGGGGGGQTSYEIVQADGTSISDGNLGPNDEETVEHCLEETVEPSPEAAISSSVQSGCSGVTIEFYDLSTNNPTAWAWSFEGGEPSTSEEQNPVVTFADAGNFDVTLAVANEFGQDQVMSSDFIEITQGPAFEITDTPGSDTNSQTLAVGVISLVAPLSYEWSTGEDTPSITINESGEYSLTITDGNDCSSSQTVDITITDTGIESMFEGIKIYPNPAAQQLFIETANLEGESLATLKDLSGKTILIKAFNGNSTKLDLPEGLANGTYLLNLQNNEQQMTLKVVVMK